MKHQRRWAASILLPAAALAISAMALPSYRRTDDSRTYMQKAGWPLVGGDPGDTHYSTLSQINTDNVKSLGGRVGMKKFEDSATTRVTPVVKDGLMFLTAATRVYALDARTGAVVWNFMHWRRAPARRQAPRNSEPSHCFRNSLERMRSPITKEWPQATARCLWALPPSI